MLGALGIGPVNVLASPAANPWIIVMINTYQYAGIAMIVYLAGLQSIPKDYYEAAKWMAREVFSRFSPSPCLY